MEKVIENDDLISFDMSKCEKITTEINLMEFFTPKTDNSVLLILNQQINLDLDTFKKIWKNYRLKIVADGGADKLYEFLDDDSMRLEYKPDFIIGDLDSVDKKKILPFYKDNKVKIIKQLTQYSTDFTKALNLISLYFQAPELLDTQIDEYAGIHDIYEKEKHKFQVNKTIKLMVLNAIGGRFDQTIQSVSQLYNLKKSAPYIHTCYLTNTDLIILIPKDGTVVLYDLELKQRCMKNCGLLPLGGETIIHKTVGFKWDMDNWNTCVQGKVSTSNRLVSEQGFYVNCSLDLIMNIEFEWKNLKDIL